MFTLKLLLGHLVGDYLLQWEFMAQNKFKNTLFGWWACFVHCFIYSVCVALFLSTYSTDILLMTGLIFITHFPIDKFSLAKYILKWEGKDISKIGTDPFASFVYIVADNTLHFLLMAGGIWLFFPNLMR